MYDEEQSIDLFIVCSYLQHGKILIQKTLPVRTLNQYLTCTISIRNAGIIKEYEIMKKKIIKWISYLENVRKRVLIVWWFRQKDEFSVQIIRVYWFEWKASSTAVARISLPGFRRNVCSMYYYELLRQISATEEQPEIQCSLLLNIQQTR